MSVVVLAVLMWAVTYPARALPLVAVRADRLPPLVQAYLRLVGPAVLAALASVAVLVDADHDLHAGIPVVAVAVSLVVSVATRNVLLGLVVAVLTAAVIRAF